MIETLFADTAAIGATAVTAWPEAPDRAVLRLTLDGESVAGRWFGAATTARTEAEPGTTVHGRIVLHRGGVDRRLPEVAAGVGRGERLVAHRVGKRAVLQSSVGFRKLVRASRLSALRDAADRAAALDLSTPVVLDQDACSITLSPLPGRPLHELIRAGAVTPAQLRAVGRTVAALHGSPLPAAVPIHDTAAELAVTRRWTALSRDWGAGRPDGTMPAPPPPPRPVLLHRDLHDKQLLLDGNDVGVLDFDLAAGGDPALDLANLIEHFHLRRRQGHPLDPDLCAGELLEGYRPDSRTRAALPFHRFLARRRLDAVYAFRATLPRL